MGMQRLLLIVALALVNRPLHIYGNLLVEIVLQRLRRHGGSLLFLYTVTLLVPAGSTYLLKPTTFFGPCKSAVIVTNIGLDGTDRSYWILFNGVKNLTVKGECKVAPTALTFQSCNNLRVKNLRFKDSQQMHVSFSQCANVDVSSVTISAPGSSPNTDGVHVSGSINVMISNSIIRTGDDCLSIVGGSRAVTATNIVCGPGHGISIGSLGANGAEDTVSDILVDTARLEGTTNGVRIKTWQGGKGYARNITFKNIVMDNVKNPIIIDQNYCDSTKPCSEKKSAVAISGVTYKNVRGTSATDVAVDLDCSRTVPCRGIVLQDINLVTANGVSSKSVCHNINLSKNGNFVP
ncbi:unnamed protein product [Spirodela intermedia]|uniref:Polygalacturonase n=1 Tax=Spirodela intermedia TaxID=51605 RepID=A0ABN7ECU0_SPIIN|nr:unnamed protein product [Spirodela intermedia]